MVKSNKYQLFILKYFLILIGSVFILISILLLYNPEQTTDWNKLALFSSIGIILIGINFFVYDYFKLVKVGHQKLMYLEKNDWKEVKWEEVDKIFRVRLVSPPIYFAKVGKNKKTIIFPTESSQNHIEANVGPFKFVYDNSKMGEIIKKAKTNYEI